MHVGHLRLRDFRNYARMDVAFTPGFHVLIGLIDANIAMGNLVDVVGAQGKAYLSRK